MLSTIYIYIERERDHHYTYHTCDTALFVIIE